MTWRHRNDPETGVANRTLDSLDDVIAWWLVYFGCTNSSAEKEAVMDVCLVILENNAPIETSIAAGIQAGLWNWLRAFLHVCVSPTLLVYKAPLPALSLGLALRHSVLRVIAM